MVAASYETQQAVAKDIVHGIVEYGREERLQLGPQMTPRDVTVCEDESFLCVAQTQGVCLRSQPLCLQPATNVASSLVFRLTVSFRLLTVLVA